VKFSIGDKIVLKRTGEEGIVMAYINPQMLEVEVNGTTFPVYADEVDHPYLKWFTEKKKPVAKSAPEQLPVERIKDRIAKLPKGIYLSFIPVFKANDMEDIVDHLKIHLLNELPQAIHFSYEVRNSKHKTLFGHEGNLHPFGNVYLHNVLFEDMNEQPRFNWTLEAEGSKELDKAEGTVRIKTAKLFEHINQMLQNNEPSFSYLLIDDFAIKPKQKEPPPEMPIVPKTTTRSSGRIELPKNEVDLHIENLVETTKGMSNDDIIHTQLQTLEYYISLAIKHRQERMIVIHGLGKGVLREAVHKILKQYPAIARYTNEWQGQYGFGATEVYFEHA
jgi:hypothetical protein